MKFLQQADTLNEGEDLLGLPISVCDSERIDGEQKASETRRTAGAQRFSGILSRWNPTLFAFFGFFLTVSLVQRLTGAVAASFGLYPDEPAHYLSSLLVRDYLASGFSQSPITFAVHYYTALPYFAIGYWPPAFYAIGGVWMLLFGVHRASALALTAVIAALLAATVFHVLRQRGVNGWTAAIWGFVVLSIPQAIVSSSMYMLDLPVALFSLWALLEEIRFSQAPDRPRHAIGYALYASLAFLSKYSGAFVFLFPIALVASSRKWSLLRNKWFWAQPAIVVAACGPWALYTHQLMYIGLPPRGMISMHNHLALALAGFLEGFSRVAGPVLVASAAVGIAAVLLAKRWNLELWMYAAAPVCVIVLLVASPVDAEGRQFVTLLAPLVLLIACAFGRLELLRTRVASMAVPGILLIAGMARCAVAFPHFPPDRLHSLIEYVDTHPNWEHASILLPPGCEGPAVAEFAEYALRRPQHILLRPSKIMGVADWWGISKSRYSGARQLEEGLARNSIDLIVVHRPQTVHTPVDSVIGAVIAKFPDDWRLAAVIKSPCGRGFCGVWDVYASTKGITNVPIGPVFRERTLNRFDFWHIAAK